MSDLPILHDTYVWSEGRKWFWRCLTCHYWPEARFRRRMDADDAATDHTLGVTP